MCRSLATVVLACLLVPWALARQSDLGGVHGSSLKLAGAYLLVGTTEGSVVGFDAKTGKRLFVVPGTSKAPVKDIAWIDGRPWWITRGSPFIHSCTYDRRPLNIDLTDLKLGPYRRLGVWQGMLVIHTEGRIRFLEPGTRQVLRPSQVLPKDVAEAVEQGETLESWSGGSGMIVTLRHFGEKASADEPEGTPDVALLNAWSFDRDNHARLLGGYTASIAPFRDTEGTHVQIDVGGLHVERRHGAAEVGNLFLGPEGVVALQRQSVVVVPFAQKDWNPEKVQTKVAPEYAQVMAARANDVWWADGSRLLKANLSDGSVETYLPLSSPSNIVSIVVDRDVAYVLTEDGSVRSAAGSDTDYSRG